jgi:hypothetical protein
MDGIGESLAEYEVGQCVDLRNVWILDQLACFGLRVSSHGAFWPPLGQGICQCKDDFAGCRSPDCLRHSLKTGHQGYCKPHILLLIGADVDLTVGTGAGIAGIVENPNNIHPEVAARVDGRGSGHYV